MEADTPQPPHYPPSPAVTPPCSPRHSLHAIASQLSPQQHCTGIELLEADTFNLHCFQVRGRQGTNSGEGGCA